MARFRPIPDYEVSRSCADRAIQCVDQARQCMAEAGLRPYRVFLVWVGWTADENADGLIQGEELDLDDLEVGVGRPRLLEELEILPTPNLSIGGVAKSLDSTGLTERGGVRVDQISARFDEDVLMGLKTPHRNPVRPDTLLPGVDFFWEVQLRRPAGYLTPGYEGYQSSQELRGARRRFHVSGTPELDMRAFQWVVQLVRTDAERGRGGELEPMGDGGPA